MKEYFPSEGDVPPPVGTFPPPGVVQDPEPPDISKFSLVRPWTLSRDLPLKERWESLRFPHPDGKGGTLYKIDKVAVDLATKGLRLIWLKPPPMNNRNQPPPHLCTSRSKSLTLLPLVEQWEERGIVTGDLTVIPDTVHFSRLFSVTKKNGGLRPVLDLSYLNTFILTPALKMEAISSILPHLHPGMWATSLDVTDAFLSVKLSLPIQKYFCFVLNGKVYMFLRLPFGLTTAPWAFSRLMRPIKKFLRLHKLQVLSFLDDFLIAAHQSHLCSLHTTWTADLLEWLGFMINEKKSEQAPPQTIIYLGVQIDLRNMTLALPQDHVDSPLTMRGGDTFVSSDSAPARVSSGSSEFCRSHAPVRQIPSYSSYSLEEHLLFGESQGRYHSSG